MHGCESGRGGGVAHPRPIHSPTPLTPAPPCRRSPAPPPAAPDPFSCLPGFIQFRSDVVSRARTMQHLERLFRIDRGDALWIQRLDLPWSHIITEDSQRPCRMRPAVGLAAAQHRDLVLILAKDFPFSPRIGDLSECHSRKAAFRHKMSKSGAQSTHHKMTQRVILRSR